MNNTSTGNGKSSQEEPKEFYLLSPDGFTLNVDAKPYTSIEKARKDFEQWAKTFESQGYYSSPSYGRIPLEDLGQYMILHDKPFYNV
jgi:hypothetical protein